MMVIAWGLAALWLAAAEPVPGQAVLTVPASIEREARQIEGMLIAPCCWTQTVSEHQSQAAEDVKLQIRTWLLSGMTRQQVLDGFARRYGNRILAEPPNRGFSRFLYVAPVLVFAVSGAGLVWFVRRVSARRIAPGRAERDGETPGAPAFDLPPVAGKASSYEERLDEELRDMD